MSAKIQNTKTENTSNQEERPPVVVIMGHIDHGKSTLLDYIRKTNVVEKEAGGITQCISAYEVLHKDEHGKEKKITFLDTPGHEAFARMRDRGARIADIAILIVSAEDGVKPQTIEAWKTAVKNNVPTIVAINKIDKPGANVEKTKMELAQNEIYLENYGGKVPFALISAKDGTGVDDLLSLILIMAEIENFTGNKKENASGFVVESNLDPKRGIEAVLLIKNGLLKKGMFIVVENCVCSTRMMEDFKGKKIEEATFSAPVKIIGFDKLPRTGAEFYSFDNKQDASDFVEKNKTVQKETSSGTQSNSGDSKKIIPIVLKADVSGMVEAIEKEIEKIKSESAEFRVVQKGVGPVSESDIKSIIGDDTAIVIGFNVKADKNATELALNRNIPMSFFDIIYKMTEWLTLEMEKRRPKMETAEINGKAKILKVFSKTKERQVMGAKVIEGKITLSGTIRIMRRDFEIGKAKIINLEKNKNKTSEVEEGSEFGMLIESKIEIAPGDVLESFSIIQK